MSNALVAYMTWNRVVPWKVLSLPTRVSGDFAPVGFGSDSPQFCGYARRARTLWVVTKPKVRRYSPPTLVAHLTIEGVYTDNSLPPHLRTESLDSLVKTWKWVAVSDRPGSEFFDLNDARQALLDLDLSMAKRSDRYWLGNEADVSRAFCKNVLQAQNRTVFLSHTHAESGQYALELAEVLHKAGFSPWLDALAIPEYDVNRELAPTEDRLSKLIRIGIRRSRLAVVVATEKFARTHWTRKEREWICNRRRESPNLRCVQILAGPSRMRSCERNFKQGPAKDVVNAIANWWRSQPESCGPDIG